MLSSRARPYPYSSTTTSSWVLLPELLPRIGIKIPSIPLASSTTGTKTSFFLPSIDVDRSCRGDLVQDNWNLSIELPGWKELSQEEKDIVNLIGKITAGYFSNFYYFCGCYTPFSFFIVVIGMNPPKYVDLTFKG
jgi:hypothetical protein